MTQAEIYKYIQPIVSGFGGFIKTNGYMVIHHDVLILMSHDRGFLNIIPIKPLNLIYVSSIKIFMRCKNEIDTFLEKTTFLGSLQLYEEIIRYYDIYNGINNQPVYEEDITPFQIYEEDDMINLPGFEQQVKSTNLTWMTFNDGIRAYKICVAKTIFPLNKGDHSSISIHDIYGDNTRVFKYRIHKSKLKLYGDLYTRQFIFEDTV